MYRKVARPEQLVFTNIATDKDGNPVIDGLTSVIFAERSSKKILTLETCDGTVVPHAAAYLKVMQQGWTQGLERLAELAAKPKTTPRRGKATSRCSLQAGY